MVWGVLVPDDRIPNLMYNENSYPNAPILVGAAPHGGGGGGGAGQNSGPSLRIWFRADSQGRGYIGGIFPVIIGNTLA